MKNIIKNKKGFTLIELLAVIVIMGILMAVAIPSISLVITSSRKDIFVNSARTFINEAEKEILNSTFEIDDPNTTYYIHIANLVDDPSNLGKSGFATWKDAYVVATMDLINQKANLSYYFNGIDQAGWQIVLVERDKLKQSDVFQNVKKSVEFKPVGKKNKIVVYDKNGLRDVSKSPYIEMSKSEAEKCFDFKIVEASPTTIITKYKATCGTEATIPDKIANKSVSEIGEYAFNNLGLTSVRIPSTIKRIGKSAFSNNKLTSLTIPASVTEIGQDAFLKNQLTKVSLSSSLSKIGIQAFRYNNLSDRIESLVPGVNTKIGKCAFCDNNLPSASFLYKRNPDGTYDYTTIMGYLGDLSEFSNNTFVIPNTKEGIPLTTIAKEAFINLSAPGWNVILPNTVKTIGAYAFQNSGISSINLPEGLTTIEKQAFYRCGLTSLNIPSTVTSIGVLAFNTNQVTSGDIWIYKRTASGIDYSTIIGYSGSNRNNLTIPTQKNRTELKTLDESSLRYLYLTGTLTLPAKVTFVGNYVFSLSKLSSVDNGDGVLTDGFIYGRNSNGTINKNYLYAYVKYDQSNVQIPNTIKTIGSGAFYYSNTKSVTIPEGVTTIGASAFERCDLKGQLEIPKNVTSIGKNTFMKNNHSNSNLTTIINKTGKMFNWQEITNSLGNATFETGVVENWYGDITITNK